MNRELSVEDRCTDALAPNNQPDGNAAAWPLGQSRASRARSTHPQIIFGDADVLAAAQEDCGTVAAIIALANRLKSAKVEPTPPTYHSADARDVSVTESYGVTESEMSLSATRLAQPLDSEVIEGRKVRTEPQMIAALLSPETSLAVGLTSPEPAGSVAFGLVRDSLVQSAEEN
jgi:hypothetical protein